MAPAPLLSNGIGPVPTPSKPSTTPKAQNKPSIDPNVHEVVFGSLLIKPWYPSFYSEELVGRTVPKLYVCHWCFNYGKELLEFIAHLAACPLRCTGPPGEVIYSKDGWELREIDGEENKLYAQNLSLFAKLFLDTKSVFYDVTTFLYYVLVTRTPSPAITPSISASVPASNANAAEGEEQQVVGFFSKEKMSWDNNNLACILVFPPWQKQGLGQILMGASYEISRREGRLGGPEKPLSDLGRIAYIHYWSTTLARTILSVPARKPLTVRDLRDETYIVPEDIITTLQIMGVIEQKKRGGADAVINKVKVKEWVDRNKVDLKPVVDPEGFVEVEEEEEDQEMEDDEV